MSRRRLLVLLKPFDLYLGKVRENASRISNTKILGYWNNRLKVHQDAVNYCQDILRRKSLDWVPVLRNNLSQPIRDVDMVITIGGDGTLLKASHFMDDSIPVLGVNSDPTQVEELEEFGGEFDATRSTGYLCAATVGNFEQVLEDVLEGRKSPSELSRISICVNDQPLSHYALNDILIAHPCPANLSRFSFKTKSNGQLCSTLVTCRSSGLRVSTAAGSTAAMLSAGGFPMPISCSDLQYMVREPILPIRANSTLMHGLIKSGQSMHATWHSEEGMLYIDGSYLLHLIRYGDTIEISSKSPVLKAFLPPHLLS